MAPLSAVMVVGALGADGAKSSYSSVGASLWVSAPGGEYGYNDNYVYSDNLAPAMMTTDLSSCDRGYISPNSGYYVNAFDDFASPHAEKPEL